MDQTEPGDAATIDALASRYKSEGFAFFVEPSPAILPPFLQNDRPDAIAVRPDRKIAIEIVRPDRLPPGHIERLREVVSQHNDWELVVFYVSPAATAPSLDRASPSAIRTATNQASELRDAGQHPAALMLAWSALEAIGRGLLPERLAHPQPAERLIEVLATDGYLMPDEADALRATAAARNAAAHGQLDAAIAPGQVDALISILRSLDSLLTKTAA